MANNNKNKDKKKGVTKKKKPVNKSSNQKENRPKKGKPDPNDSICMSKQLQMKKSIQSNKRAQKQSIRNDTERVCPNGKRMPSLAELEKMYEDSDTDEERDNTPMANVRELCTPPLDVPAVIIPDDILSPATRNKISEQVKELLHISDRHDNDSSRPPPNKRIKLDTHDNISTITCSTSVANFQADSPISIDDPSDLLNIPIPVGINPDRDKFKQKMNIDIDSCNENSSDSNKTVEYTYGKFSPKPSTSKDNNTIMQNDELFIKSLKYHSTNIAGKQSPKNGEQNFPIPISPDSPNMDTNIPSPNTEEQSLPVPIPPNSPETQTSIPSMYETDVPANNLIEDDDVIIEEPNIIKIEIDSEPQINDCDNKIATNVTPEGCPKNADDDDDDDCMIIDTPVVPITKPESKDDVIDLEYEFIKEYTSTSNTMSHMDDEVIDVDALIAQNQSILSKFQKSRSNNLDNSNLVVDVEVSTLCDNTKKKPTEVTIHNAAAIVPEDTPIVVSESNINQEPVRLPNVVAPIRPPNMVPDNSRNIPNTVNPQHSNRQDNISDLRRDLLLLHQQLLMMQPEVPNHPIFSKASTSRRQNKQKKTATPVIVPPSTITMLDSESNPEKPSGNLGDCPICMEVLAGRIIASTICGHLFCMSCISQAVKTHKRCPTCRKTLRNNGYHQIFL